MRCSKAMIVSVAHFVTTQWASIVSKYGSTCCFGFLIRMNKHVSYLHAQGILSYCDCEYLLLFLLIQTSSSGVPGRLVKKATRAMMNKKPQMTIVRNGTMSMPKGKWVSKTSSSESQSLSMVEHSLVQLSGTMLLVSCLNFSRGHKVLHPGRVRG